VTTITLREAMSLVGLNATKEDADPLKIFLAIGFTPLPFTTFITAAAAQRRPHRHIKCTYGTYGDVVQAFSEASDQDLDLVLLVLEWSDLDPRLGLRRFGSSSPEIVADVLETISRRFEILLNSIEEKCRRIPITIAMPTMPLTPFFTTPTRRLSRAQSTLVRVAAEFAEKCSANTNVAIINSDSLEQRSPTSSRRAVASELAADIPYEISHSAALADLLVETALPPTPLKGLITDLDDTLWRGLVGEVGADAVSWDIENNSHIHAIYQRVLGSLAEQGVLLGIASKNDLLTVSAALKRNDLCVPAEVFFPLDVSWHPKSEAVTRILAAWNIDAADVAFIDDSDMEIAEVRASHPKIQAFKFPFDDESKTISLLQSLRDAFGRVSVTDEDKVRLASIRKASELKQLLADRGANLPEFLADLRQVITFNFAPDDDDTRPLDLINKTNQFNLNGRRIESSEWIKSRGDPLRFVLVISYEDKFGSLGKISTIVGRFDGNVLFISSWVLSCRAFSRRIEDATLGVLLRRFDDCVVEFDFVSTEKNKVIETYFREMGLDLGLGRIRAASYHLRGKLREADQKWVVNG
jgi:FkbH-like protein